MYIDVSFLPPPSAPYLDIWVYKQSNRTGVRSLYYSTIFLDWLSRRDKGTALGLAFLAAGIEGINIKWERFFDLEGRVNVYINAHVGGLASLLRLLEAIENTIEDPISLPTVVSYKKWSVRRTSKY